MVEIYNLTFDDYFDEFSIIMYMYKVLDLVQDMCIFYCNMVTRQVVNILIF